MVNPRVELPVSAIEIDENRFPDPDPDQILEHLIRYCARFDPLLPISIAVDGPRATVVQGHKILLAARALARATIRAVVLPPHPGLEAFLARPDVLRLGRDRHATEEDDTADWHVFFFARPLTRDEKADFDARVVGLFAAIDRHVGIRHDDAGPAVEVEALTPSDPEWVARHREVFAAFSRDRVRIVSFQGRRVPF